MRSHNENKNSRLWPHNGLRRPKGTVIANLTAREEMMTKSRYGMIAGLAGAAFAAWWWRRRQTARANLSGASNAGQVIYRNTPKPSGEGII